MADRFGLLFVLVVWLISLICPGIGQDVVCQETYYVERYSEATISCEYDPSFYTVRWYLGGSEQSFLLIDDGRRSGSGYDSGEYDITDEGAMIIERAEARHDGTYKITVLNKEGKGTSETMNVYVTVPIKTLTVQDCGSSSSPLCSDTDGANTYLVCDANDFWPSVTLHWLQISQNGFTSVASSTHTTTFENTTLLFSSRSTLQYSPDLFSFQYFTCLASGIAAHQVSNKSIEVIGNIQVEGMALIERHLEIGADLVIPCPINGLPFGKLQFEYHQTNSKVIKIIESCADDNTCGDNGKREVEIENVNFKDEGLYQCISSDGSTAVQQETNMVITVSPRIPNIIIKECKDQEQCPQHIVTTGSVLCTISEFRPPMYLSIESNTAEVTLNKVDETVTEDELTGTSTTSVIYAYEVPECSENVVLTCRSVPDKYNRPSLHANLSFNSESDECSPSGGGSAVVIVIVVIVLVIAIAVSGLFIYKRVLRRENKQTEKIEITGRDEEEGLLTQTQKQNDTNIPDSGKEATETERKNKKEKKVEALFDKKMKSYLEGTTKNENVRDFLRDFQSELGVDPYSLFKSYVEYKQTNDEASSLVKELAGSGRDEWLSTARVLELLDTVFVRMQLSFTERLTFANKMYLKKEIDITEYSLDFLTNFQIHQRQFEEVYNNLNGTKRFQQDDIIATLQTCLRTALIIQNSDDPNDRDYRERFLTSIVPLNDNAQVMRHLLLLCVEHKCIDVNQYLLLQDNDDKEHVRQFYETVSTDDSWLSTETLIALLKGIRNIDTEADQFLLDELVSLLSMKRLLPKDFVCELKSCLDSELISEEIIIVQLGNWMSKAEDLGDVHMEVMYQVIIQELFANKIVIGKILSQGKRDDTTKFVLYVLTQDKDLKPQAKDIFLGVITELKLKPHELSASLRDFSDNDRQAICTHKEVSATFLDDALKRKITPWELQSIFELGIPHDMQAATLTNKKVVDDFTALKLDEKIVEEFEKLEMDEKSCISICMKFVLFNLLETMKAGKTQQKNDKYPVLFGSVINNFKAKPSDIKTILDDMKVPLDERVTILTDKRVTKKILDSSKKEKWQLPEWIDLLLMVSNENQEPDTQVENLMQDIITKFKVSKENLRERMLQSQDQLPEIDSPKLPEISSPADESQQDVPETSGEDEVERKGGDDEEPKTENASNIEKNDDQTGDGGEMEDDSAKD